MLSQNRYDVVLANASHFGVSTPLALAFELGLPELARSLLPLPYYRELSIGPGETTDGLV